MRIEHLINDTFQVIGDEDNVLFQGDKEECEEYIIRMTELDIIKAFEQFCK